MSTPREADGTNAAGQVREPPTRSQREGQILSRTSSNDRLEDFFPEDPAVIHASRRARFYIGFSTLVLLLFLIVFMIDTLPQYRVRADWRRIADLVNLTTASFFAAEWVLRFYTFRRPLLYLFQPLTIIDVLGIFPGFIKYTTGEVSYFGNVKWLRALQVLRVLRILRLTEYSVELYVTIRTLRKSLMQIVIVMMVIAVVLLTGCFLMFFAENEYLDIPNVQWMRSNHGVIEVSPFQNVFFCLYWGFVTITTVGYGDYTPVSPWGMVIAAITMFMGVFTIVFPTSIISNNFASEWETFRKAQKIHEQRVLQRENRNKRQELSRLWSYAHHAYTTGSPTQAGLSPGNEEVHVGYSLPQTEQMNTTDSDMADSEEKRMLDREFVGAWGQAREQQQIFPGPSTSPSEEPASPGETSRMGPVEYGQMIDISKKVEKNLGIPGISLGDIDMDNEINQNLVVSAMYSKLYNEAFTTLCERLVLRLVENMELESIEKVAEFLEYHPGSETVVSDWPHENKLSMLEFKLLSYVFDNLKSRLRPTFEMGLHHRAPSPDAYATAPDDTHELSSQILASKRRRHKLKHKLKARLTGVTGKLSREGTHQSVHDYMSSEIASEHQSQRPRVQSQLSLARRAQLNNLHQSNTRPDLRAARPRYNPLDSGEGYASTSGAQYRRPGSASSPAIAVTVPPSSEDTSTSQDNDQSQ
ncbi:hypothetical protein LPJ63_003938 [Coemansia sp. RSA 2711]|nr:hypothetical protein LPJ63_003938 [Coemansia sp. RSA 2711]